MLIMLTLLSVIGLGEDALFRNVQLVHFLFMMDQRLMGLTIKVILVLHVE
jgi:hypothetical protein